MSGVVLFSASGSPIISTNPLAVTVYSSGGSTIFGTSILMADAMALPTTTQTLANLMAYNGTTLDMVRSGAKANVAAGTGFLNNLPVGQYNSTLPTITNTRYNNIQIGVNAELLVGNATLAAGEDQINNLVKVEERFSYSAVAVADVQVKGSAGFLHSVTISCNDAAPTAGTLIIYDSLTETGTIVFNHTFTTTPFVPLTIIPNITMLTGIYVGMTTTGDVNFSCSYR